MPATAGRSLRRQPPGGPLGHRCRNGTEVVVYELAAMGHARPLPPSTTPCRPDTPIPASDLPWEYFEEHPRRRG